MFWLIAVILVLIGFYLIITGLREEVEIKPMKIKVEKEQEEEYMPKRRKISGGGVVLIGPVPIVFGESRFTFFALILAMILMILSLFFVLMLPTV